MLVLLEDEKMLADSASELLSSVSPVSQQRALRDESNELGFYPEVWQQFVEMGWTAIPFAEELGGLAFSYKGLTAVFEQVGRHLTASPLLSSIALCGSAIECCASAEQQNAWLPELIAGEQRYAFGFDEQMFHDIDHMAITAEVTSDTVVLNGQKTMVMDGVGADAYLILVKQKDGFDLYRVPSDAFGLSCARVNMIDSRNYANVTLQHVTLPIAAKLNETTLSQETIQAVLDVGRVCLAAELLGISEQLFATTVDYLKTRVQFDVPIGSFQALQHRAAWLFTELELSRSCVLNAAISLDEFKAGHISAHKLSREVSLALYKVSTMTDKVTTQAIQLHGGIGVTDELDLGLFLKRARMAQCQLGDRDFHQLRYARTIIK